MANTFFLVEVPFPICGNGVASNPQYDEGKANMACYVRPKHRYYILQSQYLV